MKSRFLGDSDKRRIIIGKKYSPYDLIKILLRHDCETSTHRLIIPGIGMDQWKALKPKTALKSDRPPVEVEENIASELNNKARTKQLLRSVAEQSARYAPRTFIQGPIYWEICLFQDGAESEEGAKSTTRDRLP